MFEQLAEMLHAEISVNNALLHAHEINKMERRYSYDNFRKSAAYCAKALREIGAEDVEVIPYPADGVTSYMDCIMPMAWDVKKARLEIVTPANAKQKILVDWEENPFTIGMWSPPTKPEGDTAEVVLEENMQAGANVRGKIVLNATTHHPRRIKKEVGKRGGIGVVSDWTEHYLDTADGIYWNNEWSQSVSGWYGGTKEDANESPIWCLSITPRTGSYLRNLIANTKTPVRLRATIDTRLYEDVLDVVTGRLPGKSKNADEILLLAHLYEPMPVDDATGGAAIIEILRTLKSLIDKGKLSLPERTIRVLLNQERYGSAAYFATHPEVRSRVIAGMYLDEPCYDQRKEGGTISVRMNPHAQASFSDVFITDIARHCFTTYAPLHTWELARWGGGDTALADPTVGIPMNWVTCALKRYHHNSLISDFSCLDPVFFKVNMTINATFAYFLATVKDREADWLGFRIVSEARKKMLDEVELQLRQYLSEKNPDVENLLENVERRLDYQKSLYTQRIAGLKRIALPKDTQTQKCITRLSREITNLASDGMRMAERCIKALWPDHKRPAAAPKKKLSKIEREAQSIIAKRKTLGLPVQYVQVPLDKREKVYSLGKVDSLALLWVDGKRNLLEIIHMVENERGITVTDIQDYVSYFNALIRYGYLEKKNKPAGQ